MARARGRCRIVDASAIARGFTLVELLMVLAIFGILVSLILPAVLDARGAARKVGCANNMKQIGIGLHQFESANGRLPGLYCGVMGQPGGDVFKSYSPSGVIAPFVDAANMVEGLDDFSQPMDHADPDWAERAIPSPPFLRCPADPLALGQASSYRYCLGQIPRWPGDSGGAFARPSGLRLNAIRDGLSNTAFAAERTIGGVAESGRDRTRDLLKLDGPDNGGPAPDCVAANLEESKWDPGSWAAIGSGTAWLSGRRVQASISHFFPPNSLWSDCVRDQSPYDALVTARSLHDGGVHVLMGDGRVRFLSDAVDLAIWRALSSRSGGEVGQLE